MTIAVILAGGSGRRLGGPTPKQLLEIAGRTVLERSIDAFEKSEFIDEIFVVCRKDLHEEIASLINRNNYKKVTKILHGGAERYHSSLAALFAISSAYEGTTGVKVLFHDAVRPLVSQRIIAQCVQSLDKYKAVGTAIPATDTIIKIDENGCLVSIPPRSELRQAQTPQGFHYDTINEAYRRAMADPDFTTTDDCGVVARYMSDEPIYIVEGETKNIKITYPQDISIADLLLK